MFSKKITDTDLFLDMPSSTQNLYFHLSMDADDDGFVDKVSSIIRKIGANNDDLKLLIAKNFIINFESGIVVITDWRINNYLRKDRYTETLHIEEKNQLSITENGSYSKSLGIGIPDGTPAVYVDKNRLDKNRLDKNSNVQKSDDDSKDKKIESEFNELWKTYPKKMSKKPALKSYLSARKNGTTFEQIKKGLEIYYKTLEKHKTKDEFIALLSTWLNQERWNDEYEITKERKTW